VLNNIDIIFVCTIFYVSSHLHFKSELSEKIQLNELNLIVIENTFIIMLCNNIPQKVWLGKEKIKIYFAECPKMALDKAFFTECQTRDTRQRFFKILNYSLSSACQ
jgi:hypothetical protein